MPFLHVNLPLNPPRRRFHNRPCRCAVLRHRHQAPPLLAALRLSTYYPECSMFTSPFRRLLKIPPLITQIRCFSSTPPLRNPASLPPPPDLDSQALLEAVCVNLRRHNWNFLRQLSSRLTESLVRRVILHCQSSPRLALEFFNFSSPVLRTKEPSYPDLDTHSLLIHVLVSARMFEEALCIMRNLMQKGGISALELLDALARSRKSCRGSRDVYDAIVRCCTQIGAGKEGYLVIETLRARGVWVSIHAYNNLLNYFLMSGQDDGVTFWKMYKEMLALGYVENVNTLNLLICCLCREGKINEAFSILYRMLKQGVFPNVVTFNMLIDGCYRNAELDLACNLFKKIKLVSHNTVDPNLVTLNSFINGLCKAGNAEVGECLAKKAKRERGLLPNVRTFGILIDGYAREGKPEEALRLFIEMLDCGMVPNIVVYNSLLNWLLKLGYVEEACFLLSDMRKVNASPDHVTYATLVDGFCRNGMLQEAFTCYNQSRDGNLIKDATPYNSLINHLFEQGRISEVKQLLGRMFTSGLAPDVITYTTLIDRFFKDKNMDEALKVYDEMIRDAQRPNLITYNSIIHGFCRVDYVDVALSVIEELRRTGELLDTVTYNTVIHGCLSSQRVEEAFELCHGMQKIGIVINEVTCNIFITYLCRIGCFEQAKEVLRAMLDRFLSPDERTYTILIRALCRSCNADEAIELHDYMVVSGVSLDEFTYKNFVSSLIEGADAHTSPDII